MCIRKRDFAAAKVLKKSWTIEFLAPKGEGPELRLENAGPGNLHVEFQVSGPRGEPRRRNMSNLEVPGPGAGGAGGAKGLNFCTTSENSRSLRVEPQGPYVPKGRAGPGILKVLIC